MEEKEVGLKYYWDVLSKRKLTFWSIFIFCILFALFSSFFSKPVYHVETAFEIGSVPSGGIEGPNDVTKLCKSDFMKNEIRKTLLLPQDQKIEIKGTSNGATVFLYIDSADPLMSVKILNTCAEKIVNRHNLIFDEKMMPLNNKAEILQDKIRIIASQKDQAYNLFYTDLQERLLEIKKEIAGFERTKVLLPAVVPAKPYKPVLYINLIVGVLVGFLFGFFIVYFREYLSSGSKK